MDGKLGDQVSQIARKIRIGPQRQTVSKCELSQTFGKKCGWWHLRPAYENRDDRDTAAQRRFDLDADIIRGVVDQSRIRSRRTCPLIAHDTEKNVTTVEGGFHLASKIMSSAH